MKTRNAWKFAPIQYESKGGNIISEVFREFVVRKWNAKKVRYFVDQTEMSQHEDDKYESSFSVIYT